MVGKDLDQGADERGVRDDVIATELGIETLRENRLSTVAADQAFPAAAGEFGSLSGATHMRAFALTGLLGLALLNGFLAYSGQALANEMHRSYTHYGVKLSLLSQAAFALPPYFYIVAAAAVVLAALGFWRRTPEHKLIYGAFALLLLDVAGLFAMMWGFGVVHFLL